MNATDRAFELSDQSVIRLQYTVTAAEVGRVVSQIVGARHNPWPSRLCAVCAAGLALYAVTLGQFKFATLLGMTGIAALTRRSKILSLLQFLFPELHWTLIADSEAIRGVVESKIRLIPWSTTTLVDYSWRELKAITIVGDYLNLEFQNGGGIIIPVDAFAAHDDVNRLKSWAEGGLAHERQSTV